MRARETALKTLSCRINSELSENGYAMQTYKFFSSLYMFLKKVTIEAHGPFGVIFKAAGVQITPGWKKTNWKLMWGEQRMNAWSAKEWGQRTKASISRDVPARVSHRNNICPGTLRPLARENIIELSDFRGLWPGYMNEKGSHIGWRDLGCTCVPLCNLESMCLFFRRE